MIGKGQDKKILPNGEGLTHREMAWFKGCGKGLNGEFPQTVLVDIDNMQIKTGQKLDFFTTVPLRGLIFKMDVEIKSQLDDFKREFGEKNGKCGSHHCNDCELCKPFEPSEPTMCIFDDFKECDGCLEC